MKTKKSNKHTSKNVSLNQAILRVNRLIEKHPRSFLLLDLWEGEIIAQSKKRGKIRKKFFSLFNKVPHLILHEPKKKGVTQIFFALTQPRR